jgi:hypothetical protein
VPGAEMAAMTVAAAMATVTIEPEKRSRMMISLCLAVCDCNEIPPERKLSPERSFALVYRGSVCAEKIVLCGLARADVSFFGSP